jgi:hypothetical protein
MNDLSPEAVLVRNERLAWRVLGDEAVILYPEAGTLHRLNATGTRLWELLDGNRTLADIGDGLTTEYRVDHGDAVRDLQAVAADLVDAGLVKVSG